MSPPRRDDFSFQLSTRRNVALFLLSFSLVLGFAHGSRPLIVLAEFLAVLLVIQWREASRALSQIRVVRRHYPRTFQGEQVVVTLEVRNHSVHAAQLVEVTDSFPPSGNFLIRNLATTIPAGAAAEFRYAQPCSRRRGLYVIGPVKACAGDTLGLFAAHETLDELTRLLVYPTALFLNRFPVLGSATHHNVGEEIMQAIGRSEEFTGLRGYRPGDPPRFVHWPSSARLASLVVKEFGRSVMTEVTIYADFSLVALSGLGSLTTAEFRIKVAASVAAAAISHHHFVAMTAIKSPVERTRMAGGPQHMVTLLDWLALVRPEGEVSFADAMAGEVSTLRRGSTVVFVLSSINADLPKLRDVARLLVLRHIRVIAVVIEDRTFVKLWSEQTRAHAEAESLETLVGSLRDAGCSVHTVARSDDITSRLGVPA